MNKKSFNIPVRHALVYIFLCVFSLSASGQSDRSIDGFGNNESNPTWGAVNDVQPRISPADYADTISVPKLGAEYNKMNPRRISNMLFAQEGIINSELQLSDYTWVFGQFVDHDIILTEFSHEFLDNIVVPEDDEFFTPGSIIPMSRTEAAEGTGLGAGNPRQHVNRITAFLDLSQVYGSDEDRAQWLRTGIDGKLKVSKNNLLPWNTTDGEFNSPVDFGAPFMADDTKSLVKMYVAGDVRANENPLLIAFHTLFVREHNRLCDEVMEKHPGFNDERIYQAAREKNIAIYQNIIYNEWLPAMGIKLPSYSGYKDFVNPQILNEFSTAAFRMGHTLINSNIIRMDNEGGEIPSGHISLKDAFFNPYVVEFAGGIDVYFKGMGTQIHQEFDCKVIDDVRNFLFGDPTDGGLDLAAININRGRERGISDYNTIRESIGMPRISSFSDLTEDDSSIAGMEAAFGNVNNIDAWVGMLSEPHEDEALFGPVVVTLMEMQFQALREGDRFYFENMDFDIDEMEEISTTNMRDVLMRNTSIELMQDNVFSAMPHENIEGGPELIPFPLDASIYPNPVKQDLQLKVYGTHTDDLQIDIVNYMGMTLSSTHHHIYEGSNVIVVPIQDCPRGYYNVVLRTERKMNVLKMVKK